MQIIFCFHLRSISIKTFFALFPSNEIILPQTAFVESNCINHYLLLFHHLRLFSFVLFSLKLIPFVCNFIYNVAGFLLFFITFCWLRIELVSCSIVCVVCRFIFICSLLYYSFLYNFCIFRFILFSALKFSVLLS